MLTVLLLLATTALAPAVSAGSDDADADVILGTWITGNGKGHVRILRNGDVYEGRIVWLRDEVYPEDDEGGMPGQPVVDRNNPDTALRGRPLLGLTMMMGFRHAGGLEWKKGRIYDPENGKTYRCKMRLDKTGELHVRGYVGISLFGRTTRWRRAPTRNDPSGPAASAAGSPR